MSSWVFIPLFYLTFLLCVFVISFIVKENVNSKTRIKYDSFLKSIEGENYSVLYNVKITHTDWKELKAYRSIRNSANFYLFKDFIVVFRRSRFILNIEFNPIVIVSKIENIPNHLIKEPTILILNELKIEPIVKGEIEIYTKSYKYKYLKTNILIKELTVDQVIQFNNNKLFLD